MIGEFLLTEQQQNPYDSIRLSVDNKIYIARFPKPLDKVVPILKEYDGIGFVGLGGSIQRRNHQEQLHLIDRCSEVGVWIPSPICCVAEGKLTHLSADIAGNIDQISTLLFDAMLQQGEPNAILYSFVEGIPLSDFLANPSATPADFQKKIITIFLQLEDLMKCHQAEIVIGDRWGPNQIVVDDQAKHQQSLRLAHVDIDLDITQHQPTGNFNEHAKTFEAAQVLYHLAYWTNEEERAELIEKAIKPIYRSLQLNYDNEILCNLLKGHNNYFAEHDPQYVFPESGLLIETIHAAAK